MISHLLATIWKSKTHLNPEADKWQMVWLSRECVRGVDILVYPIKEIEYINLQHTKASHSSLYSDQSLEGG